MANFTTNVKVLDAVTATTTSQPIDLSQREFVSLQITCANHTSGNGVFTVLVSNDNVNYVAYARLITNVNAGTVASSVTLSSNTSAMIFFPHGDIFASIKVVCTVTTDGSYTATLQAID